jgi:hypothetical protein
MKKSELKEYIKETIIDELTMVGPQTPSDEVPSIAKSERTSPNTVKDAIKQAKQTQMSVGVAEGLIQEMATFYKVKDKEGFKKALLKYKELKGDKFDKNALGQLLVALNKDGEVNIKDLAKEKNKDSATWNNPTIRAAFEKEDGEFTDYLEAGKGEKKETKPSKKTKPTKETKPSKEKESKKSEPEEEDDDVEVEDNWNKPAKDDDGEDEETIDKKAQAAAKKGGSVVTKLQRVTTQLKDLEKEMKEIANKWKKAEGTEKESLLSKLKDKTKIKKELEGMQDDLANNVR